MAKITYEDKEFLNKNENIADKNKVNDTDLNEIKKTVNENDDNVGDLSNLNTDDKSSVVNAINEINDKIIYDQVLSSASNTINIQNLDLLADGGIYEFEALLWTNGSNSVDCQITFNDSDDSGYFYVQDIDYGQLSGDGNLTKISKYNHAKTSITSWTTNPQSQFYPIIFRGKLYLVNSMVSDDYKIHFDITYSQILDSRQIVNRMTGLYDPDVETLTSMKIYSGNASLLYTTKSRVIIRKK